MSDQDTKFKVITSVFNPTADETEAEKNKTDDAWDEANDFAKILPRPSDEPTPAPKAAR